MSEIVNNNNNCSHGENFSPLYHFSYDCLYTTLCVSIPCDVSLSHVMCLYLMHGVPLSYLLSPDACTVSNGGCSHLCLLGSKDNIRKCMCGMNKALGDDSKTCNIGELFDNVSLCNSKHRYNNKHSCGAHRNIVYALEMARIC